MSKPVISVATVNTALLKSNPPQLVINASGFVSTPGWANGRLEPRYYIIFPLDGIQDFDFVAEPPIEMEPSLMCAIAAKPVMWSNPPAILKGVRVHSQSNAIEAAVGSNSTFTIN